MGIFPGQMLGCETLCDVTVALATKRGMHGPTALCKEGLTWECTIATVALVGWSTLDSAAIQEGGDGRMVLVIGLNLMHPS